MRIKIAIWTFAYTPGDVDIQRERRRIGKTGERVVTFKRSNGIDRLCVETAGSFNFDDFFDTN